MPRLTYALAPLLALLVVLWAVPVASASSLGLTATYDVLVTLLTREITRKTNRTSCRNKPLDRSIYEYESCYYGIVYVQGADYLAAYRRRVGEKAFWAGLRDYYQRYAFALGGTRQLLEALDAAAGSSGGGHDRRFPRYI